MGQVHQRIAILGQRALPALGRPLAIKPLRGWWRGERSWDKQVRALVLSLSPAGCSASLMLPRKRAGLAPGCCMKLSVDVPQPPLSWPAHAGHTWGTWGAEGAAGKLAAGCGRFAKCCSRPFLISALCGWGCERGPGATGSWRRACAARLNTAALVKL